MNREEAIDLLDNLIGMVEDNHHSDYDAALQMAIKALEQEPCDNAISRQAVLDVIKSMSNANPSYWNVCDVVDRKDLIDEVEQLPPVTPQPKIGHWIEHPEIETSTPEYLMFYECSECGDRQCFCKSDIHKKRFCSNCGAKMVEPQERSGEE